MEKVKKESFNLTKVKVIKKGGLDCHFEVEEKLGEEIFHEAFHLNSTKDMHPDLFAAFNQLKAIVAQVYHFNFFRAVSLQPESNASQELVRAAERAYQEIIKKIDVNEIAISGSNEHRGVVIHAVFKGDGKSTMPLKTHKLNFVETNYGFEEDLEIIIDEIVEETYLFLFENKRQQLSLFGEDGEQRFDGKLAAAGKENDEI